MTLQQEAYRRIDHLPDNVIRLLVELMDQFPDAYSDHPSSEKSRAVFSNRSETSDYNQAWKKDFMKTVGNMEIDADAVRDLRERSRL